MMRLIYIIMVLYASIFNAYAKTPITATSWLVADSEGAVIQGTNISAVRPIASITKLMTVMVVLDANQNLEEKLTQYTRGELVQLALIKSDNKAAEALCNYYPSGKDGCIFAMNTKAKMLGLKQTHFIEATGLSVFNVSTAEELIVLVKAASQYDEIRQAAKTSQIKIKLKKKWLIFNNTNPIIGTKHDFIVSKTGFINASGGCIALMTDTDVGRRIIIILGSKNTKTRIPEAKFIIEHLT